MNVNVVKLAKAASMLMKAASMLIAAAVLGIFFGAALYAAIHFIVKFW